MRVIEVHDKWQEYVIEADSDEDFDKAALGLLKERVDQGFWYYDTDEEIAKDIIEELDGHRAWEFLYDRQDHEYEWVSIGHTKSYS